jgi:hypothetical protein
MKVLVLYRPDSEYASSVESFMRDLRKDYNLTDHDLKVLNYDSRDGAATASIYDIMTQPAILVTGDDGSYIKHWEGNDLPLMQEVIGYIRSAR